MIDLDYITKKDIKEHNSNWPKIPNLLYRILIIAGSGCGNTNSLFNSIMHEPNVDNIYMYDENPNEARYQSLINKREYPNLKWYNDFKAFIKYSNDIDDIYKNIEVNDLD